MPELSNGHLDLSQHNGVSYSRNYVHFPCKKNKRKWNHNYQLKSTIMCVMDWVHNGYWPIRGFSLVRVHLYLLCCLVVNVIRNLFSFLQTFVCFSHKQNCCLFCHCKLVRCFCIKSGSIHRIRIYSIFWSCMFRCLFEILANWKMTCYC